jgi:hypothetical protein
MQQIHDIKTNELRGKYRDSFECGDIDIEFLSEGL